MFFEIVKLPYFMKQKPHKQHKLSLVWFLHTLGFVYFPWSFACHSLDHKHCGPRKEDKKQKTTFYSLDNMAPAQR